MPGQESLSNLPIQPKIAIVRQRYNPFGGAERFVERALAALVAQGSDVTLITRHWAGESSGSGAASGLKTIICDPPASGLLSRRTARDKAFCTGVQAIMARERFDIVQSHERIPGCTIFRAGDGVHAAWLAHRARLLGPAGRLAQSLSPYHRYVLAAEKAMFEHPALRAVICNSQMVADEIEHFYGVDRKKLRVIYNGVDLEDFHPRLREIHRAKQRAIMGIGEDVPVLLYVGSGFERKGVPQLLQAFSLLESRDAHLIVVGADRKLKAMKKKAISLGIGRRVHFTGPVQDVRPYYGAADAFALPTIYDPGPNAALEAMACGLPMLTSQGCGAKEWIAEGQNGFVVDLHRPAQLAKKLSALVVLSSDEKAREVARQAVAKLNIAEMADALMMLYGNLMIDDASASIS